MPNLLVYILTFFTFIQVYANDDLDLFETGNTFYVEENYVDAIGIYQRLISEGKVSVNLYFNLANAYNKTENLGKAVLYYEKALKIKPNNKKIAHNLSIAILKTEDQITYPKAIFLFEKWSRFTSSMSADMWAKIVCACSFSAFIFFAIYVFRNQRILNTLGLFLIFVGILSFAAAKTEYQRQTNIDFMVLQASETSVRVTPAQNAETKFVLHEGTKIKIIDRLDEWVEILLPNQETGWIKKIDGQLI